MGDADISQRMLLGPRIEELVEEAINEVDETMGRISSRVVQELASWHRFRQCFTALNFFIVPICLAILIAYVTTGISATGSLLKCAMEMLVTILMWISCVIGLPLYFLTIQEAYFMDAPAESTVENDSASDGEIGRELSLQDIEDGLDFIAWFRAFTSYLLHLPSQTEETDNEEEQAQEDIPQTIISSEESAGFNIPVIEISSANQQFNNLDSDNFSATSVFDAYSFVGAPQKEENELNGLVLSTVNRSKDSLAAHTEETESLEEFAVETASDEEYEEESKLMLAHPNTKARSIRTIAIQKIWEDEANRTITNDNNNMFTVY